MSHSATATSQTPVDLVLPPGECSGGVRCLVSECKGHVEGEKDSKHSRHKTACMLGPRDYCEFDGGIVMPSAWERWMFIIKRDVKAVFNTIVGDDDEERIFWRNVVRCCTLDGTQTYEEVVYRIKFALGIEHALKPLMPHKLRDSNHHLIGDFATICPWQMPRMGRPQLLEDRCVPIDTTHNTMHELVHLLTGASPEWFGDVDVCATNPYIDYELRLWSNVCTILNRYFPPSSIERDWDSVVLHICDGFDDYFVYSGNRWHLGVDVDEIHANCRLIAQVFRLAREAKHVLSQAWVPLELSATSSTLEDVNAWISNPIDPRAHTHGNPTRQRDGSSNRTLSFGIETSPEV
jgi:hypothetical protein